MLWFILVLAMIVIPSIALTVDHIRRRGFPRLPKLRLPGFGGSPTAVPEKLALQLAKAVSEGTFKGSCFRKKPDVDLFPTKKTCPHCQNKDRKVWDSAKAAELLSDKGKLVRGIRQRRFCRGCLDQLSGVARKRKEHLPELDEKKDPQSLSPPVSQRVVVFLSLGAVFFPPLLIPLTLIIAVRKGGVYWLLFILTTSFFLCLVALALAVLGLPALR